MKEFWKSKTFWAAVLVSLSGVISANGYPGVASTVLSLGAGLGLVGLRDAKGKLKWGS